MNEYNKPWKYPNYENIDLTPRNEKGEIIKFGEIPQKGKI
jgi:hypothetical protein